MKNKNRAVIVGGVRTPFVKAFGPYTKMDTIELGKAAVTSLFSRFPIPRREVDSLYWGGVILPTLAPNVGREIAIDLRMASVESATVSRACASGLQAITMGVSAIERGDVDVVIAGGSDSTSNTEIQLPQKVVHALAPVAFGKATPADVVAMLGDLMPLREVIPTMPKIAERSTGQVMGEAAEEMARRNNISRSEQDEFAVRSHHRAAAAIASGRFEREVAALEIPGGKWIHTDGLVRANTSVEQLVNLKPVYAKNGTLTAGNSSALTDGAAAVLLMNQNKAQAMGLKPLAGFRSWAYVGVDPADQLLMGPALAMPKALNRAGLKLRDIDLVDIHEAFAAQVLSVLRMLASDAFADARLGQKQAVGEIDPEILNVHGGSIAIGHPFGATGARMVTTMANELSERDKTLALIGICAAGGLGAGTVLERIT